ncbi:hypothetical protein ACMA1D_02015 [Streptomyces sp. 796.1]|uniref:hypothetical protein n=1 Tax=Streptomyces sp. 796.1 TaxID=3163029 RepID=UPI0039C994BC
MKTRAETRTRTVPHTINGETRMVPEEYTVRVPVPPRDWDHTVLVGVQAGAAAFVAASVAWTTANVGDLLAATVPAPIAYTVAAGFDVLWIGCMALEWLSRYDADRARAPRRAGHAALGIAMAAVIVHGHIVGALAAGITGALVSALAKGLWTLANQHTAHQLDPRSQQWLAIRRAEIGARLALAGEQRQLARLDAQYAALVASQQDTPDTDPDRPDTRPGQSNTALSGPARTMILARARTMPDATAQDIAGHLAGHGIQVDTGTVQAVLDNADNTLPTRQDTTVRPLRPAAGATVSDTVRQAIATGLSREETVAHVRAVHGQDTARDTIVRTHNRLLDKLDKGAS